MNATQKPFPQPEGWSVQSQTNFKEAMKHYLPDVILKIQEKAQRGKAGQDLTVTEAFRAFEAYFAGLPPPKPHGLQAALHAVGHFIRDNLFLVVSFVLIVVFGFLALYPINAQGAAQSFLDIAKIFAGVIVGGAASVKISKKA